MLAIIAIVVGTLNHVEPTSIDQFFPGRLPDPKHTDCGWEQYVFAKSNPPEAAEPVCLDGSAYSVQVRRGAPDSVLIYLGSGGACWNGFTCWDADLATESVGNAVRLGILDARDTRNPFRSWTLLYVPYCDGSVFSGHRSVEYNGRPTYHHGIQNLAAAIAVMRSVAAERKRIAIVGSSAGGYGTLAAYRIARTVAPNVPILVVAGSGIGLQNLEDRSAVAQRFENWGFGEFLPRRCDRCSEQYTYAWAEALAQDPNLRVGVIDYAHDGVLGFFLNVNPGVLKSLWDDVTGEIHRNYPDRFKRLLLRGQGHIVLTSPSFYRSREAPLSIATWIGAAVDRGSEWNDLP